MMLQGYTEFAGCSRQAYHSLSIAIEEGYRHLRRIDFPSLRMETIPMVVLRHGESVDMVATGTWISNDTVCRRLPHRTFTFWDPRNTIIVPPPPFRHKSPTSTTEAECLEDETRMGIWFDADRKNM